MLKLIGLGSIVVFYILEKNLPGMAVFYNYNLTIGNDSCSLEIDGYQIYETLLCNYDSDDSRLQVYFKNYLNGSLKNELGYEVYKSHELLFTLEKKDEKLQTIWTDFYPDAKKNVVDSCFQRQ